MWSQTAENDSLECYLFVRHYSKQSFFVVLSCFFSSVEIAFLSKINQKWIDYSNLSSWSLRICSLCALQYTIVFVYASLWHVTACDCVKFMQYNLSATIHIHTNKILAVTENSNSFVANHSLLCIVCVKTNMLIMDFMLLLLDFMFIRIERF